MFSMKLLIAFAVLTGLAAEECSLGDYTIQELSSTVQVTNASPDASATVTLTFDHGRVSKTLAPGQSETALALASVDYTATVTGPEDAGNVSYRTQLMDLRDQLLEVMSSAAGVDRIAIVATNLGLVQSALEQLNRSAKNQSCGGLLKASATNQVRVNQTAVGGLPIWVLDCS